LKAGGLYEEFLQRARFDGEALKVCDKKLTMYISTTGTTENSTRGRPEIDRTSLREILLNSVPEEIIRWGFHLMSVDEKHRLIFDQGIETGFDLIVGADGAWSKVRRLLSDQQPQYAGLTGYSWTIPNAEKTAPDCYALTNRGSLFAYSDNKTIMGQYIGDGSLNIYNWSVQPEDWNEKAKHDTNNVEELRATVLKEYETWHPKLRDYLHHAQDPVMRPLYMLPVGWKWEHQSGVTLIGDAAHVMTPFAGEGVNLGFQDALKLSQAIKKASLSLTNEPTALEAYVQEFENDMFVRARKTARCTQDMLNWTMFTDGSPRSVVEKFILRIISFHMGPFSSVFVYPLLVIAVYSYFTVFKLFY
jgi:2-polyprenyl-6-methoxyphenol hydroxylase-like FAD-dependent oxidoreductase